MLVHPTGKFDDRPGANEHIDVHPLTAAMGAEIRGVELAHRTDDQVTKIRAARFRHERIFFSDRASFSRGFGPFAEDASTMGVPGHPDVQPVRRTMNRCPGGTP